MKQTQFNELMRHIVREVITEMFGASPMDGGASITPAPSVPGMTPAMQQKIERDKKQATRNKIKADQKMLKKAKSEEKSLKNNYDITRRLTIPNLKKQIDAEKKSAMGV